jgi:CHAD domain-containing protein
MPYKLENSETFTDGVRRCGREQLETAIHELTQAATEDPVEAVHEARKALKKERSLLRLARGALDAEQRRGENAAIRDVARRLGSARDSDVMIEALDDLAQRFAGQVPNASFSAIRRFLIVQRNLERRRLVGSQVIDGAVADLDSVCRRIDDWDLHDSGWSTVNDGLLRSYRRGRKAFNTAQADPSSESLHDWRKRAKDIWYHLRILRPIAVDSVGGQADEAHRLADLLGDDHDLALLATTVAGDASEIKADVNPVIALIEHRRDQLQTEAFFLGERLFAERPNAFRRRMRVYWSAWRAEIQAMDSLPAKAA